jgi:hypothetical protein
MTNINSIFKKNLTLESVAEGVGVVVGVILVSTASILITAWVIHWILGMIGIGTLTYAQVVGLLAIWEIIKPSSGSKS